MKLIIKKKCGCCGIQYTAVPKGAVLQAGMYWFNCTCDSTLVIKESNVLVQ